MNPEKNLLNTYAAADETARLSMFLTHPSLRRQFTGIEMAKAAQPTGAPSTKSSRLIGWLGSFRLAHRCKGWSKKCRSEN